MRPLTSTLFGIIARYMPLNGIRITLYRLAGARIGRGTRIERGVGIGPNVTVGSDCDIRGNSKLHDCIIGDGVQVYEMADLRYVRIGDRCGIGRGSIFFGSNERWATMGEEVTVGVNWMLEGTGGLDIEGFVNLGSHLGGVFTHSGLRQRLLGRPFRETGLIERSPVRIETCSWIGGKVTIQPGVTIGHHSAVLPNSSVTRNVEPYTMVSGVPAKVIKKIMIQGDSVEFLPPDVK
jgi:acetyltransferase-like isoleucine patch superfamily enzyme